MQCILTRMVVGLLLQLASIPGLDDITAASLGVQPVISKKEQPAANGPTQAAPVPATTPAVPPVVEQVVTVSWMSVLLLQAMLLVSAL